MRSPRLAHVLLLTVGIATSAAGQAVPEGIVTRGVPAIPAEWSRRVDRFKHAVGYRFAGWLAGRREMLLMTGAAETQTTQVYSIVYPGSPWQQLTRLNERIDQVRPRPGRNQFLFASDRIGDENDQLLLLDLPSSVHRLTELKARNRDPRWSHDGRSLAWSCNARNAADMDVWVMDPSKPSAARRLFEAEGIAIVVGWSSDDRRVAVVESGADGKARLVMVEIESGDAEQLLPGPDDHEGAVPLNLRWSPDGKSFYGVRHDGPDAFRLARFDPESKTIKPLTGKIPWEVDALEVSDDGLLLAAVINKEGLSKIQLLDLTTGRGRPGPDLPAGQVSDLAFRPGAEEFGFSLEGSATPHQAYSFIVPTARLVAWTHGVPGGLTYEPVEPELIHFPSFDGRKIPAFVYRPPPRFRGPRPVLIDIHGGPASQFRPGFLGPANFLVNELGIALIYPNVRGSSGYGATYRALDDGARREGAVRDIGALLDWIAAQPGLDKSRVAVRGGSYGGFMALAALIRFGDRLRAGVDLSGISDFATLIETQRELVKDFARREFGDERDPKTREALRDLSPLTHASEIKAPLLVAQGANDPRVPLAQAEQIVEAVRKNGHPVWYVLARDEGHSFARRANADYLLDAQYLFLRTYLLGDR